VIDATGDKELRLAGSITKQPAANSQGRQNLAGPALQPCELNVS